MARALYRHLVTIILIVVSSAASAIDCSVQPWLVANETDLGNAISCYNGKIIATSYTISVTQNINLTASTVAINNTTAGVTLQLEGNDFTVHGQDIAGIRPFRLLNSTATFQNITITGGNITGDGGAIYNSSTLILNTNTIISNSASNQGGGIYNDGTLTINSSTINYNNADTAGGGIYNSGTLTIRNTVLFTNQAPTGPGGAIYSHNSTFIIENSDIRNNLSISEGGGVYNIGGTLTVNSSTFLGNTSISEGGGIYSDNATLTINNSTISGNDTSALSGGGIFSQGSLTINNSTINDNSALSSGGGISHSGSTFILYNSIIANSSGGACQGTISSNGYNLIEDNSNTCGLTNGVSGNIIGQDPQLDTLQDNGGPTATHALLPSSPAIDIAQPSFPTTGYDQRGVGYDRVVNGRLDMGAYESAIYALTIASTGTGSGLISSNPVGISCGMDCSETYHHGTLVTITTVADTGSSFTRWSGACTGTGSCVVTMDAARSVTADFTLNSYTITETANPTAGGTASCSPNPVVHGSSASCSATANTGYTFTNWSGDCTGTSSCDLTNVTGVRSVTANFTLNNYVITETANPTAGGSVSCSPNPVNYGSSTSCSATANTGYTFTDWSGDCTGTGSCDLTNVTGVRSVTANFTLNSYTITETANPTAGGTASCSPNPVNYGSSTSCTATANTGYTFDNWSEDCTGTGTCDLTNVTGVRSVTANFTINSYAITETANLTEGTVSCSPNPVNYGSNASCTAAANTGYTFTGWSVDCTGTGTCDLTNVTGVRSVTANFTLISYAITETASPTKGGTVTCTPDPVNYGSSASCSATPASGFIFDHFSGDCSGQKCELNNVTNAPSVTAVFTMPIPVMEVWGLTGLAGLLALFGIGFSRRRA